MSDRLVVVGGGPAGLMAAGMAADCGAQVLLIEKTPRLGNKLRLTGGGRGNITHAGDASAIAAHLGMNGAFLLPALQRFGPRDLIAFMRERDVEIVIEPDGRVFPASRNAHSVLSALRNWCLARQVTFRYRSRVTEIIPLAGRVHAVQVDGLAIRAGAVVLATGGMSYPNTGSTGDGFVLAANLGHRIVEPCPGLVPLVASDAWLPALSGVSLKDVTLTASQRKQELGAVRGDLLFTPFGLSGPAALDLSSAISCAFASGAVQAQIDLVPDSTVEVLDRRIREAAEAQGGASLTTLLQGLVPSALLGITLRIAGVEPSRHAAELGSASRRRMVSVLKGLPLTLVATRPMQEAMVTLGGVAVGEIDPLTMASRLMPGLYFAGEVIDVAGDTGGYNLQAAFSSGRLAGESGARLLQRGQ